MIHVRCFSFIVLTYGLITGEKVRNDDMVQQSVQAAAAERDEIILQLQQQLRASEDMCVMIQHRAEIEATELRSQMQMLERRVEEQSRQYESSVRSSIGRQYEVCIINYADIL